jgi:hypothetical protein
MLARWWVPLVLGVALLLIFAGAFADDWGESVVVRDADGEMVSRTSLPDSGEFGVEYVHSYYKVPAVEHFVAGEDEGFELVGVSSSSEAVLDYYGLEGSKTTDGERVRLVPEERQRFEELPLIGTTTGRRTLVLHNRRVSLFAESGAPVHLTLRVEEDTLLTEARRVLEEDYT